MFNLGGEKPYALLEVVQLLLKISGSGSYRLTPFPEERKGIDIGSVYSTANKIKTILGWSPRTSLEDGLSKTVKYFKQNRAHYW